MTAVPELTPARSGPEPERFRQVLGHFCTGVTIITTVDDGEPAGFACQSFAALSLDPPLVLVSLDRGSQLLAVIAAAGRFAVNVLSGDQAALAAHFATRGPDKFDGVAWHSDWTSPRLEGVAGFLDCEVTATIDGGDHVIVQGLVRGAKIEPQQGHPPLTYHRRAFGTHVPL